MALVLLDRVQQTGTANTTVSFTLSGSVSGFQSFTAVGDGNTTYYSATDASGNFEVGLGTYSTTGPTLTRTTILSSSNTGAAVTFSGLVNVFVTYPSSKSVNLDASGNVGIGTTSPSSKLSVAGAISATGNVTITGASALRGSYGAGGITSNFAAGDGALASNTTGSNNTASGQGALLLNTTGSANTASGQAALLLNTTGSNNTANGQGALASNTTGISNTASGQGALYSNTTGISNTASGQAALYSNTTGYYNTANGLSALYSNTTGISNTASGQAALYSNTTGSGNSAFNPLNSAGSYTPVFDPTVENNRLCMGSTGVTNAYVQVAWTVVSDARDKADFAPVPHGLDFVSKLQTTAYRYKMNRTDTEGHGPVRYGFKAQEVLALEGATPVIVDAEDLNKLRFNDQAMIAVLVNALQELNTKFDEYVLTHP